MKHGIPKERLRSWVRGELPDAEAEAVGAQVLDDLALQALVDELLAELAGPCEGPKVNEVPRVDPMDEPAAVALLGALATVLAQQRPRARAKQRLPAWAPLAAVLLLGISVLIIARPDSGGASVTEQACAIYRAEQPFAFQPGADCGLPEDAQLGSTAPPDLLALRAELDQDPRPRDPGWLQARTLVGLLERDHATVISLLEAAPDLIEATPRLRTNLAIAYWQAGDPAKAGEQFRAAVKRSPQDALLIANEARLP